LLNITLQKKNIRLERKFNFFISTHTKATGCLRYENVFVTKTTKILMKNVVFAGLMASFVVLIGCQSDDVVPQEELEGTWNVESVETESQVENEQPIKEKETFSQQQPSRITFQANGTFQAQNFLVPIQGTAESTLNVEGRYRIDGNTTVLTFREPGETQDAQLYFTTDIKRNTMTLNMNKDQLFLTLEAYASTDPLVQLLLNLYKSTLVRFNLTYSFTKS